MDFNEFQNQTDFDQDEFKEFILGRLVENMPKGMGYMDKGGNQWIHEIEDIEWDEESLTGEISSIFYLSPIHPAFVIHFTGDPVIAGCYGMMGVVQTLKFLGVHLGIPGLDKLAFAGKFQFSGQILPDNQYVKYELQVRKEVKGDQISLVANGEVLVDNDSGPGSDKSIYSFTDITMSNSFSHSSDNLVGYPEEIPEMSCETVTSTISYKDFCKRQHFTMSELLGFSYRTLFTDTDLELAALPLPYMFNIHEFNKIQWEENDTGHFVATRNLRYDELHWTWSDNKFNHEIILDGILQIAGFAVIHRGYDGVGRALGFNSLKVFQDVTIDDSKLIYHFRVTDLSPASVGATATGDCDVFNQDGELVMTVHGARARCYQGIKYKKLPYVQNNEASGG